MTESICTKCGERFHDGACCCDPSAPPLPTLEDFAKLTRYWTTFEDGFYGVDPAPPGHGEWLKRSDVLRLADLLRESAQQKHDGASAPVRSPASSADAGTEPLPTLSGWIKNSFKYHIETLRQDGERARRRFKPGTELHDLWQREMEYYATTCDYAATLFRTRMSGSGTVPSQEHADERSRSEAPKASSSRGTQTP